MNNRLSRLREKLAEKEVEAILVSQPENRRYLSGFTGSAGYLLITQDKAVLATDFRYVEQARQQAPDFRLFQITGETARWFPELLAGTSARRLGFEGGYLTFSLYRQLTDIIKQQSLPVKLVPMDGTVEALRAVKEPEEIALISQAAALGDRAWEHAADIIAPGVTEREIAWQLEKYLRENGSQSLPFEIIVASGPNAALPHARPGERVIQAAEPVVTDFGAKIGDYTSDLSRTISPEKEDETFRKVYDIVLGAQLTAASLLQEGMTGEEADRLARTVIEEAGYGAAFGHGLGHGVGLATHEAPRLGPHSADIITEGMVFTIEPGIYLPGWGGVRIEDLFVMENGKVRAISRAGKVTHD